MRVQVEPLIVSTILFLVRCMNIQRGGETGRAAYLYDPNAKEQDLQSDLIDWYRGNALGDPYIEPQDIGGGRVEIVFPVSDDRFVVELKREQANASRESLSRYLEQAAAYQATSICVGMLVVLDLASEGLPAHLRDNVWVEQVPPPEPGGTDRFVFVVRIPGNRRSPSQL